MSRTYYDYYYNVLDFELNQVKNIGDKQTSDSNKILPFEQGKRVVNETIKKMVSLCPGRFQREYPYTFEGDTDTFILPDNIYRVIAYKKSATRGTIWTHIPDSSDLVADIVSKGPNTIYNSNGWSKGDTLTLMVIQFPDDIKLNITTNDGIGDYDLVNFPAVYERLLTLEIKKRVYGRKNRPLTQFEFIEYKEDMERWVHESGGIKQKTLIAFKGHDFGRGRGRWYR